MGLGNHVSGASLTETTWSRHSVSQPSKSREGGLLLPWEERARGRRCQMGSQGRVQAVPEKVPEFHKGCPRLIYISRP